MKVRPTAGSNSNCHHPTVISTEVEESQVDGFEDANSIVHARSLHSALEDSREPALSVAEGVEMTTGGLATQVVDEEQRGSDKGYERRPI
jgi:hypothetical protein